MACLAQPAISLDRPPTSTPPRIITILHPDYAPGENTLLMFRALDDGGIDYDVVMTACGIVAGNIWTGFLAVRDDDGGEPSSTRALRVITRPDDGILRGHDAYYFQLPDADARERPYPVVARFSDWCFPHGNLPPPWANLNQRMATRHDDSFCCLTDAGWAVENAHLVPLSELDWWNREFMARYVLPERFTQPAMSANQNVIRLRADIHKVFDDKIFAIVPKRASVAPEQESQRRGQDQDDLHLVVHVLNSFMDPYFMTAFHNRKVHPFQYSVECLFARFAWTVFSPGVSGVFLTRCVSERLILTLDPGTRKYVVERRNAEQAYSIFKSSLSKSASPRKRAAGEMSVNGETESWDGADDDDATSAEQSRVNSDIADEESLERGGQGKAAGSRRNRD